VRFAAELIGESTGFSGTISKPRPRGVTMRRGWGIFPQQYPLVLNRVIPQAVKVFVVWRNWV
jgi:hypothetical protein